jgi:Lon protease-like protein
VVLIERGSEVGGGDVRHSVGTCGHIAEAAELDDGRWAMLVVGEERIRVDRWLPDDPFPCAEVSVWADVPAGPGAPDRRAALARLLRRALALKAELGDPAAPATVELDADPAVATWQAAALAPLGPLDSQLVLETEGADQRLEVVLSLLGEEVDVLAQRLAGG